MIDEKKKWAALARGRRGKIEIKWIIEGGFLRTEIMDYMAKDCLLLELVAVLHVLCWWAGVVADEGFGKLYLSTPFSSEPTSSEN